MRKYKEIGDAIITASSIIAFAIMLCCCSCKQAESEPTGIIYITDTAPRYTLPPVEEDEFVCLEEERKWRIFISITEVESGCDTSAVSKDGRYVGAAQIGKAMVDEANRKKWCRAFEYDDRKTIEGSYGIFRTIMDASNPEYDIRECCRIWNPRAGEWYYERVLNLYNEITIGFDCE